MGSISDAFARAFRDFVTDGVASSGIYEPEKSEQRAIGPLIEAALGVLSLGGVDVTKDTRSNLNADLAHVADSVALVYGDATDANNDLYIKTGASGAGGWTLTTILHDVIGGAVSAKVTELVDPKVALTQEWAENPEDVAVTGYPGQYSALHHAAKAALAEEAKDDILGALTRIGVTNAALTSGSYGSVAYTGATVTGAAQGPAGSLPGRAFIDSIDVVVSSNTITATALVYAPMFRSRNDRVVYELVYVQSGIALVVGSNNVSLGGGEYPAGSTILMVKNSGSGFFTGQATDSYVGTLSGPSTVLGTKQEIVNVAGTAVAMRVNYRLLPNSIVEDVAELDDFTRNGALLTVERPESFASWVSPTVNISRFDFTRDTVDEGVGKVVTGIKGTLSIPASLGATHLVLTVFERATTAADIDSGMTTATTQTRLQSHYFTIASLGLAADGVERVVNLSVDPFVMAEGKSYFFSINGFNALGQYGLFGMRNSPVPFAIKTRRRGWYLSDTSLLAPVAGSESDFAIVGYSAAPFDTVATDRVASAAFAISGLDLTTSVQLQRGGVVSGLKETRAITAASSGFERFDTLYFDAVNATFGLAAGTERATATATDAEYFTPVLSSSTYVALANIKVTGTAISVVERWAVEGRLDRRLAPEYERLFATARTLLPKTRARAASGTLRLLAIGDSIAAMANGSASTTAANGSVRDRATAALADTFHYLRDGYAADICDAIPLYTAVQLGRADDGAGSVHTKFGFMWTLVNHLARHKTLGTDLFYDNFAASGHGTGNLWSGGTPTAMLNAITTHITTNSVTTVVVHIGMNERGNAGTEANMVNIKKTLQATGAEVILMECPRPRLSANVDVTNWLYTNRAIRRAADYVDTANGIAACAVTPTGWLYDTRFLGQIGLPVDEVCNANNTNHPGIREHEAIGQLLIRMLS